MKKEGKLSLVSKVIYGTGDLANNLIMQMVLVYLLFFYTDIFGIPAAAAGTMFVVSRVLDAVSDIVMGMIVDKTNTRWGKMRPYLLFGSIPFGVAAVLCFVTPDFSEIGKIVYAYITYNLLCTMMTVINIPYGALSSAITRDSDERISLSIWRSLFATVGGILVNVITPIVAPVITGGNLQTGYALTMGIYAIVGIVVYVLVFFNTKEVFTEPKKKKMPVKTILKTTLGNRYAIIIAVSMALAIGSTNIRASAIVYYFTYCTGREDLLGAYFLTVYLSIAVGMFLVTPVSRKLGRKNTLLFTLVFFGVVNSMIYVVPYHQFIMVFILSALGGVATSFTASLPLALMPDAVDYAEWKYGVRTEGAIFSFSSFAQKLAMAIGGAVPAYVLSLSGYVPGSVQSQSALNGINGLMSVIPGVILIVAAIILVFYDMTEEKFKKMVEEIADRKNKESQEGEGN